MSRSRTPVIAHVDMDAFYASVEIARRPELADVPMWVGGGDRGVVLSANYPARRFGVEGGMSSGRARRLCPQGVVLPPDHDAYSLVSRGIFALLGTITDPVEAASIDEAFCDLTGALRRLGTPRQIGELIRATIAGEQHIPASVGIGPTKFVAKIASKQAKPDGLVEVPPDGVIGFLHPLPVEAMWGVGPATSSRLHTLGLRTVADVAYTPKATLQRALGANQGAWLHDLAWGRDRRKVEGAVVERSIGSQETFSRDTDDVGLVHTELLRVCATTASRMRAAGVLGRTVALTVRFADFTTISRSATLPTPTDVTDDLFAAAWRSFVGLNLQRARIRRVGVRVEGLVDASHAYQQLTLDSPERGMREVEVAADEAIRKFGPTAVRRASLTAPRWPRG